MELHSQDNTSCYFLALGPGSRVWFSLTVSPTLEWESPNCARPLTDRFKQLSFRMPWVPAMSLSLLLFSSAFCGEPPWHPQLAPPPTKSLTAPQLGGVLPAAGENDALPPSCPTLCWEYWLYRGFLLNSRFNRKQLQPAASPSLGSSTVCGMGQETQFLREPCTLPLLFPSQAPKLSCKR